MCNVVLLARPGHPWPMLLAANRDEKLDRPSLPPAAHWPDQPDVIAGKDVLAGGTWLGINSYGVVAAVLNRLGSLGPAPGKSSRGELPLLALRHPTAVAASRELSSLNAGAYRSFNLVLADSTGAWWLRGTGHGRVDCRPFEPGTHMVTARDPDDFASIRVARNLPRFRAAPPPEPPDWASWQPLLADNTPPADAAINIPPFSGFGTVSSALIGLGSADRQFLFAGGPPHTTRYAPVDLPQRARPQQA